MTTAPPHSAGTNWRTSSFNNFLFPSKSDFIFGGSYRQKKIKVKSTKEKRTLTRDYRDLITRKNLKKKKLDSLMSFMFFAVVLKCTVQHFGNVPVGIDDDEDMFFIPFWNWSSTTAITI
jgi:hypothetical protein